jgi:uncharacterized protein (TIGR02757 family)
MSLMDNRPYGFIISENDSHFKKIEKFCHRTFNATDAIYFLNSLRNIYLNHGGLRTVFEKGFSGQGNAADALKFFRSCFFEIGYPDRSAKHVSDVSKGSSAKRLNMFLRWMVRKDNRGVDFGLWKNIDPAWLMIPLDLHCGSTARRLGLLQRKYDDWGAVEELTGKLRMFDPSDPVKYDFALFGSGINEKL